MSLLLFCCIIHGAHELINAFLYSITSVFQIIIIIIIMSTSHPGADFSLRPVGI